MSAPLETVTLTIGGSRVLTIENLTAEVGAEKAVRTARVTIAPASLQEGLSVRFGDDAVLTAGSDTLLTGYVRDLNPSFSADSHTLTIGLCSKTADDTESSCEHPTGYLEKTTLKKILEEAGSTVEIVEKAAAREIPRHQLVPGETRFRTVERIARRHGVMLYDDGDGRLVLADKPDGRHEGGLVQGVNIVEASATYTEKDRHDTVTVKGQSSRGHGPAALRIQAVANDPEVRRRRPLVLVLDGEATEEDLKTRADARRRRAAGRSVSAQIATVGWRDRAGVLWTPNRLVYVDAAGIGMRQDMVIKSVTFSWGERTTAQLSLVDPRAYGGDDPKGSSSGGVGVGTDEATVEVEP